MTGFLPSSEENPTSHVEHEYLGVPNRPDANGELLLTATSRRPRFTPRGATCVLSIVVQQISAAA